MALEDIIRESLHEATDTDALPDQEDYGDVNDADVDDESDTDTDTDTDEDDSSSDDEPEEKSKAAPDAKDKDDKKVELTEEQKKQKERDERYAKWGVRAPKPGQRENRLPHSRVVKIVGKAEEHAASLYKDQIVAKDKEIQELRDAAEGRTRIDELAETDADRFIQAMAAANPKAWGPLYKRLQDANTPAQRDKVIEAADRKIERERPRPDGKFADGSEGYTPDGLQKLLDWTIEEASERGYTRAKTEFEKRFGPIEQEHKANTEIRERMPKIKAEIDRLSKLWGKPFEDDRALKGKSEVLAYAERNNVSLTEAASAVLLPKVLAAEKAERDKLLADRTKLREEILDEVNERSKGAVRTTPSSTSSTKTRQAEDDEQPKGLEDIIREAWNEHKASRR